MIVFKRGREAYIYYVDSMSTEALETVMENFESQGFEADTERLYK